MAYDIYGQRLEPGFCEIHPWIMQEYPCLRCLEEEARYNNDHQLEKEYHEYCERQYEQWIDEQMQCMDGGSI